MLRCNFGLGYRHDRDFIWQPKFDNKEGRFRYTTSTFCKTFWPNSAFLSAEADANKQ